LVIHRSATAIDADFTMISDLGIVKSFSIWKALTIDKASYSGNVVLENFDLGFWSRSGKISMNIDVEGRGLLKISKYGIRDVTKIDFNNTLMYCGERQFFKAP
jgi:hypothetical protein